MKYVQHHSNRSNQPAGVNVPITGANVIPDNTGRQGLIVTNAGAFDVWLALNTVAGIALAGYGIFISSNGGSWDGMVGGCLWTGAVDAIAVGGTSLVSAVELL